MEKGKNSIEFGITFLMLMSFIKFTLPKTVKSKADE